SALTPMNESVMAPAVLFSFLLAAGPLPAQPQNFLQRAFGTALPGDRPLLSQLAPGFSLTVASRDFDVQRTSRAEVARLSVAGIPLQFDLGNRGKEGFNPYRTGLAPGSKVGGEQVRFDWKFPRRTTSR